MKIAVLGASGMLGAEFCALLNSHGHNFVGFQRQQINASMASSELSKLLAGFDAVVNCIAYTAVDLAETNVSQAMAVNAEFVRELAAASLEIGAHVYHYSTDYVFSGASQEPYLPGAARDPLNVYGLTKAKGEEYLEESGTSFTILRTAWLYGQFGKCFPKTISSLLKTRESVSIVDDQFGQPTWTKDVASLTLQLIGGELGLTHVHATSSGLTSWYGFGLKIAENLGEAFVSRVKPTASASYPTPAQRPTYSALANDRLERKLQIRDWELAWTQAKGELG